MIVLASASPRRKELMKMICEHFEVVTPCGQEIVPNGLSPDYVVAMLATKKAKEVAESYTKDVVIGADTLVEIGGVILGKPKDQAEAGRHLRMLSGKTHSVHTGVCICHNGITEAFAVTSSVTFDALSEKEIADYIATGEPLDKAGSYGIQGYGARYVQHIRGDFFSIMGLPVHELYKRLAVIAADQI